MDADSGAGVGRGGSGGGAGTAAKVKAPTGNVAVVLDDAVGRDRAEVDRALRTFLPGIRRCYVAALRVDPGAEGLVRLALGLRADGTVDTARADGLDAVRGCVESTARGWRFPAGDAPVTIQTVYKLSH